MSSVIEQFFRSVVVKSINDEISKHFQGIKDDLEDRCDKIQKEVNRFKKLDSSYTDLRVEIEDLKKLVSGSGVNKPVTVKSVEQKLDDSNIINTLKKEIQAVKSDVKEYITEACKDIAAKNVASATKTSTAKANATKATATKTAAPKKKYTHQEESEKQ